MHRPIAALVSSRPELRLYHQKMFRPRVQIIDQLIRSRLLRAALGPLWISVTHIIVFAPQNKSCIVERYGRSTILKQACKGTIRTMRTLNYEALAAFRYELRRFLNFSERAAREAGIEPQQHQALLVIKALPDGQEATIGVLAERLQIQHHSAVELADRLEVANLSKRSRSQDDRREVLLRLTPKGERILRRLTVCHQAELNAARRELLNALRHATGSSRHGKKPPIKYAGSTRTRKARRA